MSQKIQLATLRPTPYQKRGETERNEKLVALYEQGEGRYSYNSLSRIFKVSPTRVGQIIKAAKQKRQFKNIEKND